MTYRRPEGLRRLLESLSGQRFEKVSPDVEIVVIDNDAQGSARDVVDATADSCPWSRHYDTEPRRGIPQARNRAVAYAMERFDFIVFIDDDEAPEPQWLERLILAQRRHDADVVAGPVLSVLPPEAPPWIAKGGHFDHARHPSGHSLSLAASGNVLIRSDVFRSLQNHFDERLAYSGGSDSLFFQRVHLSGRKMVWADDAVVHEWIPASRANAGWLVRRALRHGITFAQRRLMLCGRLRAVPTLIGRCGIHLAAGVLLLPAALLRGKHAWVMCLRYLAYGIGIIGGMFGGRYEEYRETHGR